MGRPVQGRFDARGRRIAIVASRFNEFFTRELLAGAHDCLAATACRRRRRHRLGAGQLRAPAGGAAARAQRPLRRRDLPRLPRSRATRRTSSYVAAEVTKGIAQVGLETGVPVVFGVVTAETLEQAIERAGTKAGNKGFDAALSALELIDLCAEIDAKTS